MIKQRVKIIQLCVVIIKHFLKSMEVLLSVEYMIPPLIFDGGFIASFLFYELYICITVLVTFY